MSKNYWKRLKTETIFKHPRVTLVEDTVELPNGKQTPYLRYEALKDYVTVIAQQDNKILLIKEYSYPHDEWLWQFPEGDIESGEDPLVAAKRELAEETGLRAATTTQIGLNYDHHRRTARKDYIVVASDITEGIEAVGDEEEIGIKTAWFRLEEINVMISNGDIKQKNMLAAWPLFLVYQSGK